MTATAKLLYDLAKVPATRRSSRSLGFIAPGSSSTTPIVPPGTLPPFTRRVVYDLLCFISLAYEIPCDLVAMRAELAIDL